MIILGILILFTFVLLRSTVSQNQDMTKDSEQSSLQNDFNERFPIQEYVKTCLKEVTYDGIELLFSQGGNIYQDQGGLVVPNASAPRLRTQEGVISYGIIRQRMQQDTFFPPPPDYPFEDDYVHYQKGWPYYGQKTLPPLCIPEGANNRSRSFVTCTEYGPRSIQKQLQEYVSSHLSECLNGLSNISYYVTENEVPSVSVVLGTEDVMVRTDSELGVTRGGNTSYVPANISTRVSVRLKKIYDFIYELITNERFDLFFTITEDYKNWFGSGRFDSAFTVTKSCPLCSQGIIDNVITVTDRQSLVRGVPLQFRFAIQNRPPVLEWIHTTPRNMTEQDIIISEDQELEIEPIVYDPDEDAQFTVSYEGWQEDYLSSYDAAGCTCDSFDCPPHAFKQDCQRKIEFPDHNKPQNLTRSNLFSSTQRAANVGLSHNDIGFHTVRVTVTDRAGLKDWQDIKILVTDYPTPDAGASGNLYSIDKQYATIEDPYILNASQTTYYNGETDFLEYTWAIDDEEGNSIYSIGPIEENSTSFPTNYSDISLITTQGFTEPGNYSVGLEVNDVDSGDSSGGSHPVEVGECFVDLNGSERSSTMAPFNTDNPYYARRYCCVPNEGPSPLGTYANQSTECHNQFVTRGNLLELSERMPTWTNTVSDEIHIPGRPVYSSINSVPREYSNDLFSLRYKRYCSGTRGNVCTGPTKRIFTFEERAEDFTFPYGADFRCQGYQGSTLQQYTQNTFANTQLPSSYPHLVPFGWDPNYCYSSPLGICSDPMPRDDPRLGFNESGPYSCQDAECIGGECRMPSKDSCFCDASQCGGSTICQGISLVLMDSADALGVGSDEAPLFVAAAQSSYTSAWDYCDHKNRIKTCTDDCDDRVTDYFMSTSYTFNSQEGPITFSDNEGCDADTECALQKAGDKVNYPNATRGCNQSGIYVYCFPYTFDENSELCKTSAAANTDCATNDVFFPEYSPSGEYTVAYKSATSECIVCDTTHHMREYEPSLPSSVNSYQAVNYDFGREDTCSVDCGASPVCEGIYESEFETYGYLGLTGIENQKMLFMYYIDNGLPTPSSGFCDANNRVLVCGDECQSQSATYFMANTFDYTHGGISHSYVNIDGCNADDECTLRMQGQISSDEKSRGCNQNGRYVYCAPYAVNPATGSCYAEAPTAEYCADETDSFLTSLSSSYTIVHEPAQNTFDTGDCLICDTQTGTEINPSNLPSGVTSSQAIDFTTPQPGRCNVLCGADSQCDGQFPRTSPSSGQCDTTCSYVP